MTSNEDFDGLSDVVSSALLDVTRTVGQISNEDLAFHRSSNPALVQPLEAQTQRLVRLTQSLITTASLGTEIIAPEIADVDSVEDNWKGLVDVLDNLLEKADACLDEYTGFVQKISAKQEEQSKNFAPKSTKKTFGSRQRRQNLEKPQLKFEKLPNNNDGTPFKPIISFKPNALTSLEDSIVAFTLPDGSVQYVSLLNVEFFTHLQK